MLVLRSSGSTQDGTIRHCPMLEVHQLSEILLLNYHQELIPFTTGMRLGTFLHLMYGVIQERRYWKLSLHIQCLVGGNLLLPLDMHCPLKISCSSQRGNVFSILLLVAQ